MSRKMRMPSFRILNKTLFVVVTTAVVASSVLTVAQLNMYSADTTAPKNKLIKQDVAKIFFGANTNIKTLQAEQGLLKLIVNGYEAGKKNPMKYEAAGSVMKYQAVNSAIVVKSYTSEDLKKKQYEDAKAKLVVTNMEIAKYKRAMAMISDDGTIKKPSTTTIDVKKIAIGAKRIIDNQIKNPNKGIAAKTVSAVKKLVNADGADIKKEKELQVASNDLGSFISGVNSAEQLLSQGKITQDVVTSTIAAVGKPVMARLNNLAISNPEISQMIIPSTNSMNQAINTLYAPISPDLDVPNPTEWSLIGQISDNFGSYSMGSLSAIPLAGSTATTTLASTINVNDIQKATPKMTPIELGKIATQSANVLGNSANKLSANDRIKLNQNMYYYFKATSPEFAKIAGVSQDNAVDWLMQNQDPVIEVMNAKTALLEANVAGNGSPIRDMSDSRINNIMEATTSLNNAKAKLYNNLQNLHDLHDINVSGLYDTVHARLNVTNNGVYDEAASKKNIALLDNFKKINGITTLDEQFTLANLIPDQNKFVAFLETGTLYDANNVPIKIDWKNSKLDSLVAIDGAGKSYAVKIDELKATAGGTPIMENNISVVANNQQQYQEAIAANPKPLVWKIGNPANATMESCLRSYVNIAIAGSGLDPTLIIQKLQEYKISSYEDIVNAVQTLTGIPPIASIAVAQNSSIPINPLDQTYTTGLAINMATGQAEYKTSITRLDPVTLQPYQVGYISFNPTTKSVDAQLPLTWGNKRVTLFSDPRTADVYVQLASEEKKNPLFGSDKNVFSLMTVTVSQSGRIGGSFKAFNQVFNYNPNSSAFEVPIAIPGGFGTVFADTKGNIRGQVSLTKTEGVNNASLYFDRTGNIGLGYELKTGADSLGNRTTLAGLNINKDGDIGGTVDLGKVIGGKASQSFKIGFDKSGISGVTIPMAGMIKGGVLKGTTFGLGVSKDGSLSFGGFIPVPLLPFPVPISAGQDSSGNVRLNWPGGSIKIWGNENRPQDAPQPTIDEVTGNPDASVVFFKHSFKKGFKTVRVYQIPGDKISADEQMKRGDLIFDVYNDLLKRNPSVTEFMNWYFYTGHELVKFPEHQQSTEARMRLTEEALRRVITKGPNTKVVPKEQRFGNTEEYRWILDGKDPLNAPTRPQDIMTENPFIDYKISNAQATNAVDMTEAEKAAIDPVTKAAAENAKLIDSTKMMEDFFKEITDSAKNDPLFPANEKIKLSI